MHWLSFVRVQFALFVMLLHGPTYSYSCSNSILVPFRSHHFVDMISKINPGRRRCRRRRRFKMSIKKNLTLLQHWISSFLYVCMVSRHMAFVRAVLEKMLVLCEFSRAFWLHAPWAQRKSNRGERRKKEHHSCSRNEERKKNNEKIMCRLIAELEG